MTTTQDTPTTDASRARIVPGGLKANLAANREETLRWVDDAPLRLVAAALLDAGPRRQAKVGEIENALTGEVIENGGWNRWWNVVRPRLQKSGDFSYTKNKPIMLRTRNLADVDSSSLSELRGSNRVSSNGASQSSNGAAPAAAKASSGADKTSEKAPPTPDIAGLGGWILWVQADAGEEQPLPKSVPPANFATVLGKQPKALAGRAISRIASGIEQRVVESNNPSDKSIESWQDALVAGLNRLSGVPDQQDAAIKEAVLITARVVEKHRRSEFQDVVAWMAAYTSVGENAVKTMSDAILNASRTSSQGADALLGRLSKRLDSPVRKSLWLELMQSNLTTRRDEGLLRKWLGMLDDEDRADAITYLLGVVQGGDSVKFLDSLLRAEWETASDTQRARLSEAVALSWQLRRDEPSPNGIYLNGAKPTAQLGTWLKALDAVDRYDVISHLIRAGGDAGMIEAIASVLETEWKIADDEQRHVLFNAVALGWALHHGLRPKTQAVMREALLELAGNGAGRQDSRLSELADVVGEAASAEVDRVRDEYERKLGEKDQELAEKVRQLDHANGLIEFLQGEIRTKRQSTELDITRDAITILGIALQELATSPSSKSDELSNVQARITLALSTLGVKPIGEIGETVEFDPRLHETDDEPNRGTLVDVTAPGMQFSRRKDNPMNVVKMQVKA